MRQDEAATLLAPLRELTPADQSGVDIGRALHAGRRRSRRRIIGGVLAAAVLAALTMAGVPTVLKSWPDSAPAVAVEHPFSITQQFITVGTAGGYTSARYRTGRFEQVVELERTDTMAGYGRVTAYAPGHAPRIDTAMPAGDVNGLKSYWVPRQQEPTLAVLIEDVWVVVRLSGPDMDLVDRAHQVAQAVKFGSQDPVYVPFLRPPIVPGLRLVGVQAGVDRVDVQLLYGASEEVGASVLAVGVNTTAQVVNSPNDTVNGRQAVVQQNSVSVLNVDGKGAVLTVRYDRSAEIGGVQTLKDVAGAVELVSDLSDRGSWSHWS